MTPITRSHRRKGARRHKLTCAQISLDKHLYAQRHSSNAASQGSNIPPRCNASKNRPKLPASSLSQTSMMKVHTPSACGNRSSNSKVRRDWTYQASCCGPANNELD